MQPAFTNFAYGLTRDQRANSVAFLNWKTFFNPVGVEAGWQNQHAKARESRIFQGGEGRPEIRALLERAAAAVKNYVGIFCQRCRVFLEVGDALLA